MPVIMDYDPQGSSIAWLQRRSAAYPEIYGIEAYKNSMHSTRSWQLRVPHETTTVLVDSPASITHDDLRQLTGDATSLLADHVAASRADLDAAISDINARKAEMHQTGERLEADLDAFRRRVETASTEHASREAHFDAEGHALLGHHKHDGERGYCVGECVEDRRRVGGSGTLRRTQERSSRDTHEHVAGVSDA